MTFFEQVYGAPQVKIKLQPSHLPCGGYAEFDEGSGCSYRCWTCMATVGSIGQPEHCKEEARKWEAYEEQGMWKWDYSKGEPVKP